MKTLISQTGGYKRHMDYLLTLQSELTKINDSLFKGLGHDLVLSGCELTDHENGTVSITSGMVYVGGKIVRFAGADNIPDNGKAIVLNPVPVQTDPDDFFDGTVKNTYKEEFAIVGPLTDASRQIAIGIIKLYNIEQYINDIVLSYGQKGETKWIIDLDGSFLANFDNSGLGITARWMGWAICNGNNGTPNMQGRTAIGVGQVVDGGVQYNYANNSTGGETKHKLTIQEMPRHQFSINYQTEKIGSGSGWWGLNRDDGTVNPNVQKYTNFLGNDVSHNNMQPYRAGYYVIRIS